MDIWQLVFNYGIALGNNCFPSMTQISGPQNQPGVSNHGPVWLGETTSWWGHFFEKKHQQIYGPPPKKMGPKTDEFIKTENTSVVPKIDSLILRRANWEQELYTLSILRDCQLNGSNGWTATTMVSKSKLHCNSTPVDGKQHAPVDRYFIPLFTSQVVRWISSINNMDCFKKAKTTMKPQQNHMSHDCKMKQDSNETNTSTSNKNTSTVKQNKQLVRVPTKNLCFFRVAPYWSNARCSEAKERWDYLESWIG